MKDSTVIFILIAFFIFFFSFIAGGVYGSRQVEGYDVNFMHYRMSTDKEYDYCPYCGEYIGEESEE